MPRPLPSLRLPRISWITRAAFTRSRRAVCRSTWRRSASRATQSPTCMRTWRRSRRRVPPTTTFSVWWTIRMSATRSSFCASARSCITSGSAMHSGARPSGLIQRIFMPAIRNLIPVAPSPARTDGVVSFPPRKRGNSYRGAGPRRCFAFEGQSGVRISGAQNSGDAERPGGTQNSNIKFPRTRPLKRGTSERKIRSHPLPSSLSESGGKCRFVPCFFPEPAV